MTSAASKLARRFYASYFNVGDVILYGKYKNHRGKIVGFGQDKWGNPTIEVEPIPKGRKQNKIMGLFKIWRADVKEKALANLVDKSSSRRLVARYLKAYGIEVGREVTVNDARIHRYRDAFVITDLTNAGLRGKKVKVLSVNLGYGSGFNDQARSDWFDELGKALVNQSSFDDIRNYLNTVKQDQPYLNLSIREERGIDIEPTGKKITLKTNTGLEINAAPDDFRVLTRHPLTHPESGKPMGFQDTNYHSLNKASAAVFFTWLQKNLSTVNNLDMDGLRRVWDSLDVKYDYR